MSRKSGFKKEGEVFFTLRYATLRYVTLRYVTSFTFSFSHPDALFSILFSDIFNLCFSLRV